VGNHYHPVGGFNHHVHNRRKGESMRKCKTCGTELHKTTQRVIRFGREYTRSSTNKQFCDPCRADHKRVYSRKYGIKKRKENKPEPKKTPQMIECICPKCRDRHMMPSPTHSWRYCGNCHEAAFYGEEFQQHGYEEYAL
jgi:hypothetical protein